MKKTLGLMIIAALCGCQMKVKDAAPPASLIQGKGLQKFVSASYTLMDNTAFLWKKEGELTEDQVAAVLKYSKIADAKLVDGILLLREHNATVADLDKQLQEALKDLSATDRTTWDDLTAQEQAAQTIIDQKLKLLAKETDATKIAKLQKAIADQDAKIDGYRMQKRTINRVALEKETDIVWRQKIESIDYERRSDEIAAAGTEAIKILTESTDWLKEPEALKFEQPIRGPLEFSLKWQLNSQCPVGQVDCNYFSLENGGIKNLRYNSDNGFLAFDLINHVVKADGTDQANERYVFQMYRTSYNDRVSRVIFQGDLWLFYGQDSRPVEKADRLGSARFTLLVQ